MMSAMLPPLPALLRRSLLVLAVLAPRVAAAAEPVPGERVELQTRQGTLLVGELIDVRDGRYWLLLDDGTMVSAAIEDVTPGGAEPPPATLPLPDWGREDRAERTEAASNARAVGGGFELGLLQGGRVRFRNASPVLHHVDARLSIATVTNAGTTLVVLTGGEAAFLPKGPIHLAASLDVGFSASGGALVGVGGAFIYDPRGAFELRGGAIFGIGTASAAFIPVLSGAWMW